MTSFDEFSLGRLLGHICRLQATRADQLMEQIGLYRAQAGMLLMLSDRDGLMNSEIAENMHFSPAAATRVIQRLEKAGFLERRPDPSDERVTRVFLRDEGRAVIEQIHNSFQKLNGIIVHDISPEEQQTLHDLLIRILNNLQEIPFDQVD
ncbi:MAG: MarR family transcriptional regulator [Chloroflexi bacterium]|nr:MarR family transcriptional regulator [Chloroflexota bacterium]